MSTGKERFFHLLKLAMGRRPNVDVAVNISTLIEAIEAEYASKNAIGWVVGHVITQDQSMSNSSNAIYISDLLINESYIEILLVRGDPTIGKANYVNIAKREVKPALSNDPDAVPAVSAHLVIEKTSAVSGSDAGRHRAILERASGLGKTMVREFLALLLDAYAKKHPELFVTKKKPKKKGELGEQVSYTPTVRLNPQPNASLQHDLQNGRIGGFELMRGVAKYNGPAEGQMIIKTNVRLHAQIIPTKDLNAVVTAAKNLIEHVKDIDFDSMKLDLIDADDNIRSTEMLPMENIETSDMRYCRTMKSIDFSSELEQCYAKFHNQILNNAKKFFKNKELWS